jgi:hypothetical protein
MGMSSPRSPHGSMPIEQGRSGGMITYTEQDMAGIVPAQSIESRSQTL